MEKTYEWEQYKERLIDQINRIDSFFSNIEDKDEPLEIMFNIDSYLPNNLLEHFVKEKGTIKIINPNMFNNMNVYLLWFKDANILKKFVESKIFFKVIDFYF